MRNILGRLSIILPAVAVVFAATSLKADADQTPSRNPRTEQSGPPAPSGEPKRFFQDCSTCPEMVELPVGKFLMGSSTDDNDEKPPHEVVIGKPVAVGRFEVTFDEWSACAQDGGCAKNKQPGDEGWGRGRHPVINVSWTDAKDYVTWLSGKTGKNYRLLSEAEWEYAARAGTTTRYAYGDRIGKDQANFQDGKQGEGQTKEVGSYPANPWGLFDMHGNVWEWVEDCYAGDYADAPADGSARTSPGCSLRVLRGGSWDYPADEVRSSVRYKLPPIYRVDEIGFRIARDL